MLAKVLDVLGEPINYQVLLECSTDIDALVVRYLACVARQQQCEDWAEQLADLVESEAKMPTQYKGRDRTAWASVELFRRHGLSDPTATSLIKTFEHDKSHFDKLVASLYPPAGKTHFGTGGPAALPGEQSLRTSPSACPETGDRARRHCLCRPRCPL